MKNTYFFGLAFLIFILTSCATSSNGVIKTLQDQETGFHLKIEDTTKSIYTNQNYKSLAYGQLKVFKPNSFVRLDSLYTAKQKYIENNDLRELQKSGIEDLIPGYRAEAKEDLHEVQYEIEHIFETRDEDSMTVHHSYYLFDYQDSLINITPFYSFKIAKDYQDYFYAYQFNSHFVTNRDLYISEEEWNFIQYFRNQEINLIKSDKLDSFMNHTMQIMDYARKSATVDFREISKKIVIKHISQKGENITIEDLGKLMVIEDENTILGYEHQVIWKDEDKKDSTMITLFSYSPFLEINNISTKPAKKQD